MNSNTFNHIRNNEIVRDLENLNNIRDIVFTPSKHDSCIIFINTFIVIDKIKDTKHSCFTGQCNTCGFRILWMLGIRWTLFRYEIGRAPIINLNVKLAGPKFTTSDIVWRY